MTTATEIKVGSRVWFEAGPTGRVEGTVTSIGPKAKFACVKVEAWGRETRMPVRALRIA